MTKPRIGPRKLVYRNPNQSVYEVRADFGGFEKTYWVDDHGERVGVVVPKGGDILLVRQYRLLIDGGSLEIPGGRIDEGESGAEAAARECSEEAGVRVETLEPLVSYHPGMDTFRNPTQIFVARGAMEAETFQPDEREVVERRWMPLDACLKMIFSGEIRCGLTITGLLAFAHRLNGARSI